MNSKVTFLDWCNKYARGQQELARLQKATEEGKMTHVQIAQANKTLKNLTDGIDLALKKINELIVTATPEELEQAGQIIGPYLKPKEARK